MESDVKIFAGERLADLVRARGLPEAYVRDVRVVSRVLPFKVNSYVVDEMIDWGAAPDDPMFRLTFGL